MIRQAIEGRITWFPDLNVRDIPYPLPKGISIQAQRNMIGLEIQGLVGTIPLLNGDTLQIIPKIGRVNFLRLLFKAEGLQHDLEREYDEFVEYSLDDKSNIDSIVARQLMLSAAEIMNRSPKRGRIKRRREGTFAVGSLDIVATAMNIAFRKQEPVVNFVKEKTLNIPENRVITEAIIRAWTMLDDETRIEYGWIKEKWVSKFPRSKDIWADLEHVEEGFASLRYGGSRDYYRKALMLSHVVLGSNGLGFSEASTIHGDAILLNTAHIFEKYLRNVISQAYSESGYLVTKGGIGVSSLYTDGSFELNPDIVISRDGRILLIVDAKYKQPTAEDHYQMHTYLKVYRVNRGLLLAPLYVGESVVSKKYSTVDKTTVTEIYLPMSDLSSTERFLAEIIENFP